jgi:hypothetical protein
MYGERPSPIPIAAVDRHDQIEDDDREPDREEHVWGETESDPDRCRRVGVRYVVEIVAVSRPLDLAYTRQRSVETVAVPLDDESEARAPKPGRVAV